MSCYQGNKQVTQRITILGVYRRPDDVTESTRALMVTSLYMVSHIKYVLL